MGNLPLSRTITLNPGDPFPSALGNELQDVIIAKNTSDSGDHRYKLSAYDFVGATAPTYGSADGFSMGNNTYRASIPLKQGQTLKSVTAIINGQNGGTFSIKVFKTSNTRGAAQAARGQLGSTGNSTINTTGLVEDVSVSGLSELCDSSALVGYYCEISASGSVGISIIGYSYVAAG